MMFLEQYIFRTTLLKHQFSIKSVITKYVKYSSTNSSNRTLCEFSNAEQEKILTTLNHLNRDHSLSLNVSQAKIRNLENYRKKMGPFKSLDELLEVDGLGLKMLEKLCRQIITEVPCDSMKKLNNGNKKNKQFIYPALPAEVPVSSIVGIHLAPVGVSWAKLIQYENKVDCWGHLDFVNLPKKMLPTDTFRLALTILSKLPTGSIYVFEGSSNMGLQGQKQPSTVSSYTQQMELLSMLLALINTSTTHNIDLHGINKVEEDIENKVYFLRPKLPARLFKTLVGNECVSSTGTVLQLLNSSVVNNFSLPCTPITLGEKMKNNYHLLSSAHKELWGQALMLTVTFTDLCVTKNPVSINAVTPGKKNNV